MTIYTNQFGGAVVSPAQVSFASYTITASPFVFTWPTAFLDNTNNLGNITDLTSSATQTAVMPPSNLVSNGQSVLFVNLGAHTITINLNDNATLLVSLAAGEAVYAYLTDNTVTNVIGPTTYYIGAWQVVPFGGGVSAVTSVAAVSGSSNLVITGSPITNAGTFTFNFANDLLQLISFGSGTGIAARTATNTWALRQVTGTANQIQITNPAGVAGNINVGLVPNIQNVTSIRVSNISIGLDSSLNPAQNTISSTNTNGNIVLDANGTGEVQSTKGMQILSGNVLKFQNPLGTQFISFAAGNLTSSLSFLWPTTVPAAGQVLQYVSGNNLGWANVTSITGSSTVNAIARYSNTTGSLTNSLVLIDNTGFITGASGITVGNITIQTAGGFNTISTSAGDLTLTPNGASEISCINNVAIKNQQLLKITNGLPGNYIAFKAAGPLALTTNTTFTLPVADGSYGDVFAITDGLATLSVGTIPGRNRLTNGAFQIWQPGTTFTSVVAEKIALCDGWATQTFGAPNVTFSRQVFPGSTGNSRYCIKAQRNVGNTDTNRIAVGQTLRSVDCVEMAGNYVTLSFLAKAGANFSSNASTFNAFLQSGTTTSNTGRYTTGFTSPVTEINQSFILTTTFSRFYVTSTAPIQAGASQLFVEFSYAPVGTAGADDSLYITDVQLEKGKTGTAFDRLPFSIELLKAQSFYQKSFFYDTAPAQNVGINTGEAIYIRVDAGPCNSPTINFSGSQLWSSTPTITLYNPAAANAQIRNETRSEDLSASAVVNVSQSGFTLTGTASVSTVAGDILGVHYTSDARLI